jgi:molybdopterin molybdotransferase
MISYEQAVKLIEATAKVLPASDVPLQEARGLVAAHDLLCPAAVPPFDNSAMDGFAVRAQDTVAASSKAPVELEVLGMITAGESGTEACRKPGTAWEIMTGAPVPEGYDSVVPVEQVVIQRDSAGKPVAVRLHETIQRGRNLRRAGEDFAAGDAVLAAGQLVEPSRIMGLAATGISTLSCRQAPRVATITTGNELTNPDAPLHPGHIHDSNGPYLEAAIASMGGAVKGIYRSADSADELGNRIESIQNDVDVILTTGGVSAGRMDFVPMVLEQLGADILFHRVAIRPGKPILFARLPDGTLVFGLPGNPIAVAVGLRFFVTPALRRMRGLAPERFPTARLASKHHKKPGLKFFAKAHATTDPGGVLRVDILPGQESFKISPLMRANCWLVADADQTDLPEDSPQSIAFLYPEQPC